MEPIKGISEGGGREFLCLRVLVEWVGIVFYYEQLCSIEVKSPTLEPDFLGSEPGSVPN